MSISYWLSLRCSMLLLVVGGPAMILRATNLPAHQRDIAAVSLTPGAPGGAAPLVIEALADLGTIGQGGACLPPCA